MATTIEATFDGQVFRPSGDVALPPNTTVPLIVEPLPDKPASFLQTARSLKLDGPPDWATNLDAYLDGTVPDRAGWTDVSDAASGWPIFGPTQSLGLRRPGDPTTR